MEHMEHAGSPGHSAAARGRTARAALPVMPYPASVLGTPLALRCSLETSADTFLATRCGDAPTGSRTTSCTTSAQDCSTGADRAVAKFSLAAGGSRALSPKGGGNAATSDGSKTGDVERGGAPVGEAGGADRGVRTWPPQHEIQDRMASAAAQSDWRTSGDRAVKASASRLASSFAAWKRLRLSVAAGESVIKCRYSSERAQ
jgi:hypothetical protein